MATPEVKLVRDWRCPECQNMLREADGGLWCTACEWNSVGQATTLPGGRRYIPSGEALRVDKDGTIAWPAAEQALTADEYTAVETARRAAVAEGNLVHLQSTPEAFLQAQAESAAQTDADLVRQRPASAAAVAAARKRLLHDWDTAGPKAPTGGGPAPTGDSKTKPPVKGSLKH